MMDEGTAVDDFSQRVVAAAENILLLVSGFIDGEES